MSHALPPETAEGWYALHQLFRIDRDWAGELVNVASPIFEPLPQPAGTSVSASAPAGWSAAAHIIGAHADVMFIHFRRTLDEIGEVQRTLAKEPWMSALIHIDSYLSVTEAGLYRMTAELAKAAVARGGKVGDEEYLAALEERRAKEIADPHVQKRLYPERPAHMPYVCFYPMSKRRNVGQNWYALPVEERGRLMYEHSKSGRKYAGKIFQVITGSIGFNAWEWGVTLFASDPLQFKKIVSEMRFDEASAQYADFGEFYTGRIAPLAEVVAG